MNALSPEQPIKLPKAETAGILPLLRAVRRILGDQWNRLFLLAGISLISATFEVAVLYLVALLATEIVAGGDQVTIALPLLAESSFPIALVLQAAAILLLVVLALAYPVARSAAALSRVGLTRTRNRLLEAYLNSEWASRSTDEAGHIQTLIAEFGMKSENLVQQTTLLVVSLSSLAMIVGASVAIAPFAAALSLLGLLAVALLLRPLSRRVKRRARQLAGANKELASRVAETASVTPEIAAFGVEDAVKQPLRRRVDEVGVKLVKVRTLTRLVPSLFQYTALGLVLAVVAVLSTVSPTGLIAAGPVLVMLIRALGYSKQAQHAIQAGNTAVPYADLIESEIERLGQRRIVGRDVQVSTFKRLELQEVTFAYPDRPPILKGVNLSISAGETVGIVGPSGGGKTTLVQLLLRLRPPLSGSIRIDKTPLDRIDDDSWARLIAFVPQDNQLVFGTISDNIRFFRSDFSQEQVEQAAKQAHLHDEIVRLPMGYGSVVGAGGAALSGGQRQRLGIARAMLGHPEILVLDEPTSALDQKSEALIRTTLEEIKGRQTLIIVAHRPSTLQICDRLLTVEGSTVQPVPALRR